MCGTYCARLVWAALVVPLLAASFACGDDGPAEAAEEFIRVIADQDCAGMVSYYSAETLEFLGPSPEEAISDCQEQLQETTGGVTRTEVTRFEVTDVDIEGDRARVEFSMAVRVVGRDEEVPREDYLDLVKEGGEWKADLV